MIKRITGSLLLMLFATAGFGQSRLSGKVYEISDKGDTSALTGATVHWLGSTKGTHTDIDGKYILEKVPGNSTLVISFIGYISDTVQIDSSQAAADFFLSNVKTLQTIEVVYHSTSSEFSFISPVKVETLGQRELTKAACCNLSESFETNPSVDVSFADAVTGTKQIQMLGLSGQYSLITKENMPYLRGLASIYGLSFIPGTWIHSIQLSKGAGSVINGFESFTGQINTELQRPESSEKLFFNAYGNANARNEYNLNLTHRFNETWSTALLSHFSLNPLRQDMNHDGFLDIPTGQQYNLMNKWSYQTRKGFEGQFGGSYVNDVRKGGQMTYYDPSEHAVHAGYTPYGIGINSEKWDVFAKNGYVFKKPETSMGLQLSFLEHRQNNFYGLASYTGFQQTFYANYIFQGLIGNTNHKFKAGGSFLWDHLDEKYRSFAFRRVEAVPGAFVEYAYNYLTKFNLVAGGRADYHNYYGLFYTPRLHMRYAVNAGNTVFRASAGRALKTANILAENSFLMASSRDFVITPTDSSLPYGLRPEIAWNYGLNFLHKFKLDYRDAQVALDVYRTDFADQVVIDLDYHPQQALVYNLRGKSFSNTLQAEFSWEVRKRLDMRVAYRYVDTRTQYVDGLLPKYLLSRDRAFLNLAYETKKGHWQFDFTTQWNGPKRLPKTAYNPIEYQRAEQSPAFFILNGQVTWRTGTRKSFDIYLGVENALNMRQPDPIVSAGDPFSRYFDAGMIWGPIYGRMLYGGLRYKIK
jgi:outer membrane receptor for ferrienterochelin and colicins